MSVVSGSCDGRWFRPLVDWLFGAGFSASLLLLPLAQRSDTFFKVATVVVEVVGAVVSRWFSYIIEIIRLSGIQRGVKRAFAGIPNRPGRQARENPCIVGRATVHVTQINFPVAPPLSCQLRSVDDGGIDSERHILLQTVVDHRSD